MEHSGEVADIVYVLTMTDRIIKQKVEVKFLANIVSKSRISLALIFGGINLLYIWSSKLISIHLKVISK